MPRTVQILNTLTGRKDILRPRQGNKVGLYACGVTTYDECHIGHAMQAVYFDVIRNYLKDGAGYDVTYVRNFTDVDDKIIARAEKLGKRPDVLSEEMIQSSNADMNALGIQAPDKEPRVSQTIPAIQAMIAILIEKGFAYTTAEGDVYYRVRRKTDYGKLSNRDIEGLQTGTRDLKAGTKDDGLDFALWKHDTTPHASWDSPWGVGRPGWHIECSAMSKDCLGPDTIEIHGGGRDLVFPHHENEIAQSEAANDTQFAQIWMHSGLLTMNKQKMSKSIGNTISIKEFLKKWHPEVLIFSYIQNHYRSNIDFVEDVFNRSQRRLLYYYETLRDVAVLREDGPEPDVGHQRFVDEIVTNFHAAMCDDFNTPLAVGELNKLIRRINQWVGPARDRPLGLKFKTHLLAQTFELGRLLRLFKTEPATFVAQQKIAVLDQIGVTKEWVEQTIERRLAARSAKQWQDADAIRNELAAKGISLRDGKNGTDWGIAPIDDEA